MLTTHSTPSHSPYIPPPNVPHGYHSYLEYLHPSSPWRDLAQAAWTARIDTDLGLRHAYGRNVAATTLTFPDRYTTLAVAEPNNPARGGASGVQHHSERRAYNRAITEAPGHGEPESARFFTERHPCDYTRTNPGVGCLPWMQTTFPGRFDYVSLTPQYAREEEHVRPFLQRDFQATWDRLHPPPPPAVPMPPLALMPPPPAHGHTVPPLALMPPPPIAHHAASPYEEPPWQEVYPAAWAAEDEKAAAALRPPTPHALTAGALAPAGPYKVLGLATGGHISLGDMVELLGPYLKHKKLSVSKHRKRALHTSNYL